MKKSFSYILPIAALFVLALLAFRWISSRPNQGSITPTAQSAEGIEINDLTGDEKAPSGMKDAEMVKLTAPESTSSAMTKAPSAGEIRYTVDPNDKTRFTVSANLPKLDEKSGFYQLWIEGSKGRKKAMRLEFEKGGYVADGSLSAEFDEVKVIVSKEQTDDDQLEEVVLEGVVPLKKE